MSIHAFHSKLMSGKEEGTLFEALRRLRGIGKAAMASEATSGWSYWTDGTEGATSDPGWTGSAALSRT
jgi:hypothetical protein